MKPSRVRQVLARLIETRWPAFIWGAPGIGKSAIVRQVAADAGLVVQDLRASLLDPTDLRGIPAIEGGRAVWCPPAFLPSEDVPSGLLFLDEINAAPPLVQASLYQLVLDRQVGEYRLPAGWRIVAAGNRQHDRSVVFRLSSALANRFVHINFEVDHGDWRSWALDTGIHAWVIGFISMRPGLLVGTPAEEPAYPTPRSWEMVSDVLHANGGLERSEDILPGIIGEGAATEFTGWARTAMRESDMRLLLEDPMGAPMPHSLGDLYAMTAWFTASASEANVRRAAARLLERMPVEFAVLMARDMARKSATFLLEAGYRAFAEKHGDILAG
jgi:hypothetical protein